MTNGFKRIIRQVHLWLGLISGIIVFVISITGFLYVFEKEIREYTNKKYLHVPYEHKPFVGLKTIVENYEYLEPKQKITSLKINIEESNSAVEIGTRKRNTYYFNPYDGSLLHNKDSDWLYVILEIHRNLLLGEIGKSIQGWSVIIFIGMLITGLILWFPNQKRLLKQSLKIKWNATSKRINYDMHQVLGFYAAIILLVISFSGIYFKYDTVKETINLVTGSKLRKGDKGTDRLQNPSTTIADKYHKIFENTNLKYPGATSFSFSIRKSGELRVRLIYPKNWARKQNTIFLDTKTEQVIRTKLYKDNNFADLYEASNRDIHTGEFFGLGGKIIWSLGSLIGATLPITGFVIWWNKRKKLTPVSITLRGKKNKKG